MLVRVPAAVADALLQEDEAEGDAESGRQRERQRALLARLAELGAVPEGLAGPGLLSSFLNLRG